MMAIIMRRLIIDLNAGLPVAGVPAWTFPAGALSENGTYAPLASSEQPVGTLIVSGTPPSLYVDVSEGDYVNGMPTSISAKLTLSSTPIPNAVSLYSLPGDVQNLQQAAMDSGYLGFDWVQQITLWPSPGLSTPSGNTLTAPPAFFDPPPGGYEYCITQPGVCPAGWASSAPFYYNTSTCANANNSGCVIATGPNAINTISFYDSPEDPLLPDDGSYLGFTTQLVGILSCSSPGAGDCSVDGTAPSPPLYTWKWIDTYTGGGGGVQTLSDVPASPGGSGGITVVELNGAPVPEPAALSLFGAGLGGLAWQRRRANRMRRHA